MSRALIIFTAWLLFYTAKSQDTLKYTDGTREVVRIEEVSTTLIRYKKAGGVTVYSVPVSKIHMIVYQNGSKDLFTNPSGQAPPPVQYAQAPTEDFVPAPAVKFSGPRVGCTYIGEGTAADYILDKGKTPFVTQFGWQLETRIFTTPDETSGLAELVLLVGGLEQGLFLPSGSFMFGIRSKGGLELAMGPNVSLSGLGMAFAVGTSFRYHEIYFPVNLAFVPSVRTSETTVSYTGKKTTVITETGFRLSLLVGFNMRKR
jgi:hypothetical protein